MSKGLRNVPDDPNSGYDVCGGGRDHILRPNSRPERVHWKPHNGPIHTNYANFHSRLQSYANWGYGFENIQNPDRLAAAGFFCTHVSDHVRCFYCDIELRSWSGNDDPWVEHAYWSKDCGYLKLLKGEDFIKKHAPTDDFVERHLVSTEEQPEVHFQEMKHSSKDFKSLVKKLFRCSN
jgi:hypothetical protein